LGRIWTGATQSHTKSELGVSGRQSGRHSHSTIVILIIPVLLKGSYTDPLGILTPDTKAPDGGSQGTMYKVSGRWHSDAQRLFFLLLVFVHWVGRHSLCSLELTWDVGGLTHTRGHNYVEIMNTRWKGTPLDRARGRQEYRSIITWSCYICYIFNHGQEINETHLTLGFVSHFTAIHQIAYHFRK
jgi:hypothetical protein